MPTRPIELFSLDYPMPPRWFTGDQIPRRAVQTFLKPFRRGRWTGLSKVAANLMLGLKRAAIAHRLHRRPVRIDPGQRAVGILHGPVDRCREIAALYKSVVGPGVMTTPHDWPDLFTATRAACVVQACEWSAAMYRHVFGNERVRIWPVGIDTKTFAPRPIDAKTHDLLIYDKLSWGKPLFTGLLDVVLEACRARGLTYQTIRYGSYKEHEYRKLLRDSRAMVFLSPHETQGIAYLEALSMGLPLLAADYGRWCDPNQAKYNFGPVRVTSIPYWDERCGMAFRGHTEVAARLDEFQEALRGGRFAPRDYILEHLTLEKCAREYLRLLEEA
ncbi:MAG TPA: glycosyltransferase [Pirellulales bacterium]|jgi:glycosyltransferase involved in cell wall biosynthesis|nr:glycosyltransferase [Pirellulales bacterium]